MASEDPMRKARRLTPEQLRSAERSTFRNPTEARMAVFDFIEAFYNPRRRHSSIGMLSPAEFERRWARDQTDVA